MHLWEIPVHLSWATNGKVRVCKTQVPPSYYVPTRYPHARSLWHLANSSISSPCTCDGVLRAHTWTGGEKLRRQMDVQRFFSFSYSPVKLFAIPLPTCLTIAWADTVDSSASYVLSSGQVALLHPIYGMRLVCWTGFARFLPLFCHVNIEPNDKRRILTLTYVQYFEFAVEGDLLVFVNITRMCNIT